MVTIKADIISGMLKGAFFMRSNAVSLPSSSIHDIPDFTLPVRPRRKKEVRDPYDGLRPWSAITHGVGAVLSAVGTVPCCCGPPLWATSWAFGSSSSMACP